jgi:hypothetical protein
MNEHHIEPTDLSSENKYLKSKNVDRPKKNQNLLVISKNGKSKKKIRINCVIFENGLFHERWDFSDTLL